MKNLKSANVFKVAKWEFIKTLRSPSFLILTFVIPLLIVGSGAVGYLTQGIAENEELDIAVIDRIGDFYPFLEERLVESTVNLTLFEGELSELEEKVADGDFDGFLLFDRENIMESGEIPYYVSDTRNINLNVINRLVTNPVTVYRMRQLNMDDEQIALATMPVYLTAKSIGGEEPHIAEFVAPLAMAMILIFAVIFTGQVLMYGVIKEKKNRIVEILLSSISSLELMMGKVMGFASLGLVQIAIWVSCGLAVANYFWDISQFISLKEFIPSIFIFFFGYLLIASLFAAVGATMKDAEGGSQAQGLVIMIPMIPLFASGPIIMSPDALWVRILTYLPPFSPVASLMRIGSTSLPAWEIISMIAAIFLSAILFIYLGSKIFEGAILQYEKTLSFKDVGKMMR